MKEGKDVVVVDVPPHKEKEESPKNGPAGPTVLSVAEVMARFEQFEQTQKRIEASLTEGVDLDIVLKSIKKLDKKTRKKIRKHVKQMARGEPNILEQAVYWVEDQTGGWLPAVGKTVGYGVLGYKTGELVVKGAKAGWSMLTGNPADAVAQISGR